MNNNRIRFAPVNTGMYTNGNSNSQNSDFYAKRSSKSIDVSIVGNISVSPNLAPNSNTGVMSSHQSWSELAEAIRAGGSSPGIQIASTCPDYCAKRRADGSQMVAALAEYQKIYRKLKKSDFNDLSKSFIEAVNLAIDHGYDHIQIHAAHGYLWSLALDPIVNPGRLGLDYFYGILEHIIESKEIRGSIRISWNTGYDHDEERQLAFIDLINQFPSAFDWDISNGYYNSDKERIYPVKATGPTPWIQDAYLLSKEHPEEHFVFSGNVWNPSEVLESLPMNVSLGIARPLIADPKFIETLAQGSLKLCNYCGHCHYFSRGKDRITCPLWSRLE